MLSVMRTQVFDLTTDEMEQKLIGLESLKAQICARQMSLLREADRRQAPLADGCRSLQEWTAGRLDIAPETARQLVCAARTLADQTELEETLNDGLASFDRIVATGQLAAAGATPTRVEQLAGLDIPGIRWLTALHRRTTPQDQQEIFVDRFLTMQPTLDRTAFKLWGQLPGTDGELVEKALLARGDAFPPLPDGSRGSLGQRNADALVSISQDSFTASSGEDSIGSGPLLSLFMDGRLAAGSNGQTGTITQSGIPAGVSIIEEILCNGSVEQIAVKDDQPLAVGHTTRVIPPKLRRFVLFRDGACTADGCTSRYRLQPHHRIPWSQGGSTDPDNLITLCWFHHHVVVHQMGYQVIPDSPPGRLRFTSPGHDPP